MADLFSLWPHQHTLYTEIESAWSRNIRSVCAQLSTGGGKTRIIRMIVDAHAAAKKVIYVVAHRSTLVKQLSDELTEGDIQHGIIQSGSPYLRYRVQVCSMATLVNRLDKLPEPAVIVIDECVTGDSIVQTELGSIRIDDWNKYNPTYILSYDGSRSVYRKVLQFIERGNRNVIQIKTESGRTIKCTNEHLLLGVYGWEKAGNLKINDRIFVNADVGKEPAGTNTGIHQYGYLGTEYGKRRQKKNGSKTIKNCYMTPHYAPAGAENKYCQKQPHMNVSEKVADQVDIVNTYTGMIKDKVTGMLSCLQTRNLNYTGQYSVTHAYNMQRTGGDRQELHGHMDCHKKNGLNIKQKTYRLSGSRLQKQKTEGTEKSQYEEDHKVSRFLSMSIMTSIRMVKKPSREKCSTISIKKGLHGGFAMTDLRLSTLYTCTLKVFQKLRTRLYQVIFKIITDRAISWKSAGNRFSILSLEHPLRGIYYSISKSTYQNACSTRYERIIGIQKCGEEPVYDLEVQKSHCYFSNGFLSHNCHHSRSGSYTKILNRWPASLVLGMTATPERPDGKPLLGLFDHLITGPQPRNLIDDGYLCDYDYYAPGDVDMTGTHKRGGDYVQSESLERVDKKQIIGSAVDHYRQYADHQPAIASCVSIAHAEHVAEQFRESGYRAVAVHSKMDPRFVQRSINGLRDGSLDVLSQCEMLGEGVDIKGAVALIGLRPTASLVVFLQHVGRVLRISPGKTGAVILDHVGNWERHGLPDDPREWSLQGRVKREAGQASLKRCPGCLRPVPISTRVCPHCGNQWTETADPGERIPEEAEGKLVSIRDMRKGDRNQLVLEIARKANHLKQAVNIAGKYGVDHRGAWYIWTHELRKKV